MQDANTIEVVELPGKPAPYVPPLITDDVIVMPSAKTPAAGDDQPGCWRRFVNLVKVRLLANVSYFLFVCLHKSVCISHSVEIFEI